MKAGENKYISAYFPIGNAYDDFLLISAASSRAKQDPPAFQLKQNRGAIVRGFNCSKDGKLMSILVEDGNFFDENGATIFGLIKTFLVLDGNKKPAKPKAINSF